MKEYFPLDAVTKGLMSIFEELLGLRIERTDELKRWHEEDMTFKVKRCFFFFGGEGLM